MNDRVKPIIIRFGEDEEYTLDFNRESVKFAEERGFVIGTAGDFPMTKIPEFFYYSMRANHKKLARSQTDAILDRIGGLTPKMIDRLGQLYVQAIESNNVIQDEEDLAKNGSVTVEMD